jgi:hypothetical protein
MIKRITIYIKKFFVHSLMINCENEYEFYGGAKLPDGIFGTEASGPKLSDRNFRIPIPTFKLPHPFHPNIIFFPP